MQYAIIPNDDRFGHLLGPFDSAELAQRYLDTYPEYIGPIRRLRSVTQPYLDISEDLLAIMAIKNAVLVFDLRLAGHSSDDILVLVEEHWRNALSLFKLPRFEWQGSDIVMIPKTED